MAFNGSGTFNRIYNWTTDKTNSVKITASRMDGEDDGFATGLSTCITKDGQTTITANIPMNSKKFTGLTTGSARTDSISLGQVQDGTYTTLGTAGGSADTYTASPSPAITAYATGSRYIIKIQADNTGASTLNVSTVGAKNIKKYDGAGAKVDVEAGDLQQDQYYDLFYDGTDFVVFNPQKPYIDWTNIKTQGTTSATGTVLLQSRVTVSNGTDTEHDIDFAAGTIDFSDGAGQAVFSALTKQADNTWASGTNAGGMASGQSLPTSGTIHLFVLSNSAGSTTDAGFDTSVTATNLIADSAVTTFFGGTPKFRRVASLKTDGSANILGFSQVEKEFLLDVPVQDVNGTATTTSAALHTLTVPAGVKVQALMTLINLYGGSGGANGLITSPDQTDTAPSSSLFNTTSSQASSYLTAFSEPIRTNTSSQIRSRFTSTNATMDICTRGWIDYQL